MSSTQIQRDDTAEGPPAGTKGRRPSPGRSRRRGPVVAAVLAVLVAGGVGIVIADPFSDPKPPSINNGAATGLAQVTKGSLSARTLENGTLGFSDDYDVVGRAGGTVTKLPTVGQVISQGKVLYKVDGKPVVLLEGNWAPAYRDLSWGTEGADVRQLNTALVALGYADKDDLDPKSDYFGRQTFYALEDLQGAVGLEETGDLTLGQVVFLPAKQIRITKVNAVLGGSVASGTAIATASSTERQITVSLSASQQSAVKAGDKVSISLPTGKTTPGVVSSVGKVATKGDTKTTIQVYIRPLNPKVTGQLDQAPVQVSIVSDTAENVLSVPVNGLLALAGGGYAVEVVQAGGVHKLIPVKTGLFDDIAGKVEVSGDGLAVGQNVVVPAS